MGGGHDYNVCAEAIFFLKNCLIGKETSFVLKKAFFGLRENL